MELRGEIPPPQARQYGRIARPSGQEPAIVQPHKEATSEVVNIHRADYGRIGQIDLRDALGRHVRMADPHAAEAVRFDVPSAVTKIERIEAGHVIIDELIHVTAVRDAHADFEQVPRAPLRIDPRIAAEAKTGTRVLVRHHVRVGLFSVVPPEDTLVHLTIDGQ